MELAARGLGAGPLRTLLRIVLPMILPALLAAGLLCFITSAGEFVASEILHGPETTPASVKINELFRNDKSGATALGLCLMALGAAAVGISGWLQARASWRRAPRGDKL
jgi:ABC-type spermidine/putrescine transport system permease subunit II